MRPSGRRSAAQWRVTYVPVRSKAQAVGDPMQEGDHIGPLFDQLQWDRVQKMIHTGLEEGARLLAGGREGQMVWTRVGLFAQRSLLT